MNPHIPLYQFTHAMHAITLARITKVRLSSDSGQSREVLNIDAEIIETLWGEHQPARRSYVYERPASWAAQVKFPDPVWGRVDIREGLEILVVSGIGSPTASPVYVDQIENPDDAVLKSVRAVLDTERRVQDRLERLHTYIGWLTGGPVVEKLFAGEALAKDGPFRPELENQLETAYPQVFADEQDEYIKMNLGTWLWDYLWPRTESAGRVNILNATLQALQSSSPNVRSFALDRLSETDPSLLHDPRVKPSPEAVRLLEERKSKEGDADVKHHLDEVIKALARGKI